MAKYARGKPVSEFYAELIRRVQALPGVEATALTSILPLSGTNSDSSFAMAFGGGVDFKLSDKVAIRMIQADYVQTRFASDRQNSARLSAGIVFHIGSE